MAASLALLASLLWGTSDFAGGWLSRRRPVLAVVLPSQLIAVTGLLIVVTAAGLFQVAPAAWAWGAAAGVVGSIALACFYRGLAAGVMGVVAPIAATGVAVPVAVGLGQGEHPHVAQLVGIGVAVVGVVLAARPADAANPVPGTGRSLLLALVAAVGFGLVLVFIAQGSKQSAAMTLVGQRVTNAVLLGAVSLVIRPAGGLIRNRRELPLIALVGTFDLSANGLYAVASQDGLVSVVAVLSSLYPAVTALLAFRLLHERLGRLQAAGVGTALAGVLLLAGG
ncbi:MAG TPA: DMT family transporter [Mycobacteriales bacterium]|nr:DMT family transporter [Mycobacteriales bacterium]